MKHTSGPWTIAELRQPNGWEILGPLGQPIAIEPWHGDASHAQYREIYEANARLISAAPELLEALKVMIDSVFMLCHVADVPEWNRGGHAYEAIAQARAAIAKATL